MFYRLKAIIANGMLGIGFLVRKGFKSFGYHFFFGSSGHSFHYISATAASKMIGVYVVMSHSLILH